VQCIQPLMMIITCWSEKDHMKRRALYNRAS
jgi:hypothetical protein